MPFYDYKCKICKIQKETFQKDNKKNILYCDICKKKSLTRLISKTSFVLKGKGWYETDFKSNKDSKK